MANNKKSQKNSTTHASAVRNVVSATATKAKKANNAKQKRAYTALLIILIIVIVAVAIYGYYHGWFDALLSGGNDIDVNNATYNVQSIKSEQLSIHFIELGNGSNGDSIYIKAGDTDILIDAGSERSSAEAISNYVDTFCTDGKLEYVIATHADTDHISGFVGTSKVKGIFDRYQCETIIQFARTNKTTQAYNDYCAKRDAEVANGAKCYTALECYNNTNGAKREYQLADGITMKVLYQEYYETATSNENDYSVCLMITQGDNHYLLLGDLEEAGERSLVNNNPDLPEVILYKGGHHGSKTSANDVLLSKIKPQIICICCVAGSVEYTQNLPNTFPTQAFIDRVAPYTDKVYATDVATVVTDEQTGKYKDTDNGPLNGTIVFACTDGKITMYFSNNDTELKNTDWFKQNRDCPEAWK